MKSVNYTFSMIKSVSILFCTFYCLYSLWYNIYKSFFPKSQKNTAQNFTELQYSTMAKIHSIRIHLIKSLFYFQFQLQLSHDGSGKGAALVAAVATRLRDSKEISVDCWFCPSQIWFWQCDIKKHFCWLYGAYVCFC